jgi:hypothetical protein
MATQADVRRIAMSLPETEEVEGRFAFGVRNKGLVKQYAWVWLERITPKKPRVPNKKVLAVRVANMRDREMMVAVEPSKFFTESHYNGFPAVLVRLDAVTVAELKPILAEAWRCQAPRELTDAASGFEARRPAPRARKVRKAHDADYANGAD